MTDPLTLLTVALADRYMIARELGAGGVATVYLDWLAFCACNRLQEVLDGTGGLVLVLRGDRSLQRGHGRLDVADTLEPDKSLTTRHESVRHPTARAAL